MAYEVRTPVFEGPFDLLLHLVLRDEVEIWDVPLARVVDDYLTELARLTSLDLDVATEFLLVAAVLVELKSRRLLPDERDVEPDEELAVWEERDLLLARLLDCRTFSTAARALARLLADASRSFPRQAGMEERFLSLTPDLLAGITPEAVRAAFLRASSPRAVPSVALDHVAPPRASVVESLAELARVLPATGPTTFRVLTRRLRGRSAVIAHFLALLELYAQGLVELEQGETFGEITVAWVGGDGRPLRPELVGAYGA